jgi:2-oxoglutarate dehydrogenase E2 component (dihydrolipoamide succinyltransferase)
MKVDVVMPKMGESINEGTLIKWHKKKGDAVTKDEIIFEISTDKVDTEIPSPESGILVDIKVFENETVEVDSVVAVIDTNSNADVVEESAEDLPEEEPTTTQVGGEIIDIPMPKMGESVMEGTIIKWHKKVGEKVNRDEILYEISTDKVDTEVPSPVEGTLTEILVKENETVEVETIVARISTSGGLVIPKEKVETKAVEKSQPEVKKTKDESLHHQESNQSGKPDSNKFYSPLVMNIARKENVGFDELERISGSGVQGRVTKNDILKYIADKRDSKVEAGDSAERAEKQKPAEKMEAGEGTKIIPMDNIRKRIMNHMKNSRDTSVHVSAMIEVDMSKIYNFIKANKNKFANEGIKLTYMPFISYACIRALKEYPLMNASIDGENIVVKNYINLGIAVAVEPNGLIVPNIKNADEKNIRGLAKSIAELGKKSKTKGLVPDDIVNGTFSITNYGVFGTEFGTPIINQPEVAILGVGTVIKKPVVVEVEGADSIAIKPMMYLSLSHDHRLVDGMLGGKYLKYMKDTLESFDTSIV